MWHRIPALLVVACLAAAPARAQGWNDARTRDLVNRATARRARQLADTGLVDYTASARGYLTFLAQLGEGFPRPPKVVKADQLALEVYWQAPNFSKQRIVGRRDTLVLPTDINYHRDHLGIVQNNFPDIIRLGDGDEVRDVPHPLSPAGLAAYDFVIGDSLRIEIPGRTIDVYEVKVRPSNDQRARGRRRALHRRDDAQVVRMAFSFTRARSRTSSWRTSPSSSRTRSSTGGSGSRAGRRSRSGAPGAGWITRCAASFAGAGRSADYTVNAGGTAAHGARTRDRVRPRRTTRALQVPPTPILDSLPRDVTVATDDDMRQVQEEARALVRGTGPRARPRHALPRRARSATSCRSTGSRGSPSAPACVADSGPASTSPCSAGSASPTSAARERISLGWERADGLAVRLSGYRDFREAGDEPETSRARNTIAAQEFGSDYTQPFGVRAGRSRSRATRSTPWRWSIEAAVESQHALSVNASPGRGGSSPRSPPTVESRVASRCASNDPTPRGGEGLFSGSAPRAGSVILSPTPSDSRWPWFGAS